MTTQRFLIQRRLKKDKVEEYVQYHKNVSQELIRLYRESGIVDLSCFIHDNDLVVYIEVNPEIYLQKMEELSQQPVEKNWQALMATLNDPETEISTYNEVFRFPEL